MSPDISGDFPFEAHFIEVNGSRIHYIEQGDGDPILFLHGNPTSSYLWRNVVPYAARVGRAVAMDLIGMGRSDKPHIEYRFLDHYGYVEGFIETLGLQRLTIVVHDWGSGLGFHYASRHEANIEGLAFMEAILFSAPQEPPEDSVFRRFRTPDVGWELIVNQNMFVEQILPNAVVRGLTDAEMEHYREPFHLPASRKPIWRWPNELPMGGNPPDVVAIVDAYRTWLEQTDLPKLLFYGSPGAIFNAERVAWCREHLKNLRTVDIGAGRHYLQEDNPDLIGRELAAWYSGL
jgi:haloalkane dehalogenase